MSKTSKPGLVTASGFGIASRCRLAPTMMAKEGRTSNQSSAFGEAFHELIATKITGNKETDPISVGLQFELDTKEITELVKLCRKVSARFEGWDVKSEIKLCVDDKLNPVQESDHTAFLSGRIGKAARGPIAGSWSQRAPNRLGWRLSNHLGMRP